MDKSEPGSGKGNKRANCLNIFIIKYDKKFQSRLFDNFRQRRNRRNAGRGRLE